jgi:hypothetical protein
MKKCLISFILLLFVFSTINGFTQDTMQLKSPLHKKNIFTLGLYKQPGLDSMVDFVDGLYRVFKINKVRGHDDNLNKSNLTFVPNIGYSLATGFATSINANVIVPQKNLKDNQSIIFSELKYSRKPKLKLLEKPLLGQDYDIKTKYKIYTYNDQPLSILKELKLKKDPYGKIEILKAFWPDEINNEDGTIPDFLTLCELVNSGNDRNIETSKILEEKIKKDLERYGY